MEEDASTQKWHGGSRGHLWRPKGRQGVRKDGDGEDTGGQQGDEPDPGRRGAGHGRDDRKFERGCRRSRDNPLGPQRRARDRRIRLRPRPRILPGAIPTRAAQIPRHRRPLVQGGGHNPRHGPGSPDREHGQDSGPSDRLGRPLGPLQPQQGPGGRAHERSGGDTDQSQRRSLLRRIGDQGLRHGSDAGARPRVRGVEDLERGGRDTPVLPGPVERRGRGREEARDALPAQGIVERNSRCGRPGGVDGVGGRKGAIHPPKVPVRRREWH
mmetsp:Transcript_9576/g.20290  ORF Transcript_9576/g.20290 Transcript_9576/m.20290 type:complete len:269 (-) Transcript_9576:833-1639(-)